MNNKILLNLETKKQNNENDTTCRQKYKHTHIKEALLTHLNTQNIQASLLLSNWILTSCQPDRVTSRADIPADRKVVDRFTALWSLWYAILNKLTVAFNSTILNVH